jgi:hypothetical protein
MGRRALRALPTAIAILLVVAAYLFAGSNGRFRFTLIEWEQSHYASLTEGFLRGKVSMAHVPDPALVVVPDPYLPELRKGVPSLHDASYFEGRYYLYFTPIPSLLVHIPIKLATGKYPPDPLVGTLFAIAAFLAQAAFIVRALRGRKTVLPVWLWIAFAGLGNVTPFILEDVWMYEVAALCGMLFTSLWALSLLRFLEQASWGNAVLVGTFLALSIVSRPNLIVLGFITAAAVLWQRAWRPVLAIAIPLVAIGAIYGAYNDARFRSPFETGRQYQLTNVPARDFPFCRLCTGPELARFVNNVHQYVFRGLMVNGRFPFVALSYNEYDPAVTFPAKHEEVAGILALIPLTAVALLLLLIAPGRDRAATLLTAAGWVTMFALSICAWVTTRYELDFMPVMALGAMLAIESGLPHLREHGLPLMPLRVTSIVLACYSIVIGAILGLTGRTQALSRFNPELFEKLASWFTSR